MIYREARKLHNLFFNFRLPVVRCFVSWETRLRLLISSNSKVGGQSPFARHSESQYKYQGRPGGGSGIPIYPKKKIDKIPQIPPNIPKNNRSFEYFIPEIRSQRNKHLFGCLTFFGIPLNGWSLLSHDNRSQEKANVKLCIHVRNTVRSPRIISSAVIKATRSTPSCTSLLCILLFLF